MSAAPAVEARPWGAAALWLAFLGPFFFAAYGFCNWVSAQRDGVGSYFFEWERAIPVIPAMIVPYMSTDLFFAGALFLCATRRELRTLALRFTFTIVFSCLCFLAWPLRFSFELPPVDGAFGAIFRLLTSLDQPYNQAPSLHISLLAAQWAVYARHTRGALRAAIHVWMVLIAASTLFTFQHHFIDLPTGALVAVLSFYLFPHDPPERGPAPAGGHGPVHRRLALRYGAGSLACALASLLALPWTSVLAWPAAALAAVAVGYAGAGPAVFRKSGGRLSVAARLFLAPYLVGARISCWLHTRGSAAGVEVAPGLSLGRLPRGREPEAAVADGIRAVVDLTAEFPAPEALRRITYRNVPVLDLTPLDPAQLAAAAGAIAYAARSGPVLVHCALGVSRSAAAVIAYMLASGVESDVAAAIERLRRCRPGLVLGPAQLAALQQFAARREPARPGAG